MYYSPKHSQDTKKCCSCGEVLTDFVAYIPDKGEACMKCYTRYAQRKEGKP